jgi:hypothetical protein
MFAPSVRKLPRAISPAVVLALLLLSCGGGGSSSPTPGPSPAVAGRSYGGNGHDVAWSVVQASDGGFVFAGFTNSAGAGGYDGWVVRTDASGRVVRERTFGAADNDFAFSVAALQGGGYVVAGVDNAAGHILSDPAFVLGMVKRFPIDIGGTLTLRKLTDNLDDAWTTPTTLRNVQVGGSAYPYALGYSVRPDPDGGFIVAGAASNAVGGGRSLLLKADSGGAIQWVNYLPGKFATCAVPVSSGGFAAATGGPDGSLVRATSVGDATWSLALGRDLHSVVERAGGFVVAGDNGSNGSDAYLAKSSADGTSLLWQGTYGSPGGDGVFSMAGTGDGGFVLAGAGSGGGFNHLFDAYLVRTDGAGALLWEKHFGGLSDDFARSVCTTSDGGFVVAGCTSSTGAGGLDAWLVRTDAGGTPLW